MSRIAKIVPMPKGNYSASATYNSLDIVRNNSRAWICKVDGTHGIEPAESSPNWMMLAIDGSGTIVEITDNAGSATATTTAYQVIMINEQPHIVSGSMYMEQTKTLSVSQETVFTFSNASITANSAIDAWTSIYGTNPIAMNTAAGTCTVTFDKAESAVSLTCRIYIR